MSPCPCEVCERGRFVVWAMRYRVEVVREVDVGVGERGSEDCAKCIGAGERDGYE